MGKSGWTSALASALGWAGSSKIGVYPVSLGANREPMEFWSSFYALGCLTAYAKVHRDGALLERFAFGRITPVQGRGVPALVDGFPTQPGIFLLSHYVWNHQVNCDFAERIKRHAPGSLVIVGGPHIPRDQAACEKYFAAHPYVDAAVRHEGEVTLAELLRTIAEAGVEPSDLARADLSAVEGLTVRQNGRLVRTPDRARTMDLGIYPSPYITGEFDHWVDGKFYLPIETNRGCPYGCTFCDWGAATLAKIARLSDERVFGEVEFAAKHKIQTLGFCDANFGILPRDLDIARFIVSMKEKYGYPLEVGYTNAKTASPRLTEIVKVLSDAGLIASGQISMQTTDEQILKNVERANIKMSEYRKMITFFHKEDIPAVSHHAGPAGADLRDVQEGPSVLFRSQGHRHAVRHERDAERPDGGRGVQRKFQIVVGEDGFVESTYSFTREEYGRMFDLGLAYKLFVKLGLLKYLLYYVQIEHGVQAMDFMERWLDLSETAPDRYPISGRIRRELIDRDRGTGLKDWFLVFWSDEQGQFLFDSMDDFQAEIRRFFAQEYGVDLDGSDAQAVLAANREIMPRKGRPLPARVPLDHDVAGYFAGLRQIASVDTLPEDYVPLKQRAPGHLDLRPHEPITTYAFHDMVSLVGKLEMPSNVRI